MWSRAAVERPYFDFLPALALNHGAQVSFIERQGLDYAIDPEQLAALTSVFMTPVWAKLGARFGKREACIAAYVGLGLCWLALLVLPAGQWWLLYPLMIVFGFFNAGEQLLPNAMVPDTVEYDEMISGARREGTIYGAWVFVQQTGMAFGSFLVGVLLSTIGFSGVESADEGIAQGVRYTIALLPALCVFVGVLIIRRYPLSVSEFARIQTILVERRAAASN